MVKNIDVLLINPPYSGLEKLSKLAPKTIPLGLAYIAAYIKQYKYSVKILDYQVHNVDLKKEMKQQPKLIGITVTTPTLYSSLKLAKEIKEIDKNQIIVLGGAHPTFSPREVLTENVDIVIKGEGEKIFLNLLREPNLQNIKGIVYKKEGNIIENLPETPIYNLDELPFPARELLPMEGYRNQPDFMIRSPAHVMINSRGCPYRCIFCGARLVSGFNYRFNSPKKVLEEIEILINKYNAKQIIFWDDIFTLNRRRTIEICDEIIKRKLNIVWYCSTRVNVVDKELLEKMYKAGCRIISYGIETGSQRLLNVLKKDIIIQQVKDAIKWTNEAKMEPRGTFMIGIPTETKEDSLETIKFSKQLNIHRAKFSLATPYPGTEFYEMVKDRIKFKDWSLYNAMAGFSDNDVIYVPNGRTSNELKKLQKKAMREFYLRPKIIWHLLKGIRNKERIKEYYYGAMAVLGR